MKKYFFLTGLLCATTALWSQTFTLKSQNLGGQMTLQQVFNGFGCTGQNISPQLSWENAPAGTKSFALTMYDKDAPTGSGWWHWVVFDLPASVTSLPADAGDPAKKIMPAGAIQSLTDFGKAGFGGPCPPPGHGPHQYVITVYALKTDKLGADAQTNPALAGYLIHSQVLAQASLVAYYQR
jgi:Raf kinase inhibitor-like YbhB/YbcL family protein